MSEHVRRGGRYVRVADPGWDDPLDGTYAGGRGGRWNPPGSFPVVYLNATETVARANVDKQFATLPYGPQDLNPAEGPLLVETEVPTTDYVDLVTDAGCAALRLAATYPYDAVGTITTWAVCQPIGQRAWTDGERGIACRSAALPRGTRGEELAYFPRGDRLPSTRVRAFAEWYGVEDGLIARPA